MAWQAPQPPVAAPAPQPAAPMPQSNLAQLAPAQPTEHSPTQQPAPLVMQPAPQPAPVMMDANYGSVFDGTPLVMATPPASRTIAIAPSLAKCLVCSNGRQPIASAPLILTPQTNQMIGVGSTSIRSRLPKRRSRQALSLYGLMASAFSSTLLERTPSCWHRCPRCHLALVLSMATISNKPSTTTTTGGGPPSNLRTLQARQWPRARQYHYQQWCQHCSHSGS